MTRQRHVGAVLLAALVCVFLIAAVSARAPPASTSRNR
jgi:hypothetical protein